MKPSFLRIFQEVNTEDGRGLLVNIETPHNGLYVEFDRAKATVWYGLAGTNGTNGPIYLMKFFLIQVKKQLGQKTK
jgi:hypothetical protein